MIFDMDNNKTSFYNKDKIIKFAKSVEEEEEKYKQEQRNKRNKIIASYYYYYHFNFFIFWIEIF